MYDDMCITDSRCVWTGEWIRNNDIQRHSVLNKRFFEHNGVCDSRTATTAVTFATAQSSATTTASIAAAATSKAVASVTDTAKAITTNSTAKTITATT